GEEVIEQRPVDQLDRNPPYAHSELVSRVEPVSESPWKRNLQKRLVVATHFSTIVGSATVRCAHLMSDLRPDISLSMRRASSGFGSGSAFGEGSLGIWRGGEAQGVVSTPRGTPAAATSRCRGGRGEVVGSGRGRRRGRWRRKECPPGRAPCVS